MARSDRPFARQAPRFKPQPKVLVLCDCAKGNAKGLYASLSRRLPEACKHAARALVDATHTGEPNPSTQIHLLIARFEQLSAPRP